MSLDVLSLFTQNCEAWVCAVQCSQMSFRFNGGDCYQSFNIQPFKLFQCFDFNAGPPSEEGIIAYIEASELGGEEVYYSGFVQVDEIFTLFAEAGMASMMNITIWDPYWDTDLITSPENITVRVSRTCSPMTDSEALSSSNSAVNVEVSSHVRLISTLQATNTRSSSRGWNRSFHPW
jgi:hypothetical protein